MCPSTKRVRHLRDYVIFLEFDNDEKGQLDMKPFLNFGVFRKLQDPELFVQVRVAFDTVEWPNGVDLDPAFVYEKCEKVT
ncbi:DUF2442 domain-containing protein [Thiorhodovibrio frisius]|uniref:DUF2442 domain-containing protein n=2 Tax=Thiorhodovibrio frisius TaxID=631362 RepID=H8Z6I1_9GAMM|nr:DUF2442 domain-containing protein [Thiorhodovibrio frisius]EIC19679.1 Protein of unknown function (DUF2442) [Thiorhodovibrio frisius]WPL20353.1 hypothetical protein Thiofri_00440 [Thiorhodovibrio frisius]